MLKLTASYSKKVPVEGTDFSSHSYYAAVEVEIPDGLDKTELDSRIHDTFELVRSSVEGELNGKARTGGGNGSASRGSAGQSDPPASEKQLSYLRDIAVKQGMTLPQLNDEAHSQFGVGTVRQLSRSQASRMIESLGGVSRTSRRKAA